MASGASGRRPDTNAEFPWRRPEYLYRTPFQPVPQPSGAYKYFAALHGIDPPENLPYGLDIWWAGKKLNIEWSDGGQVVVVSYIAGDWERKLESLAADVGMYATSNHGRSSGR